MSTAAIVVILLCIIIFCPLKHFLNYLTKISLKSQLNLSHLYICILWSILINKVQNNKVKLNFQQQKQFNELGVASQVKSSLFNIKKQTNKQTNNIDLRNDDAHKRNERCMCWIFCHNR